MWVTLEQTTGLQRRASIATSSVTRAPNHQGPTSFPLESETLSLPYKRRVTSPRARFAENPIIGPTREASTRLSRRKSALKSRSPSQIIPSPSKTTKVNVGASKGTSSLGKPGSSSTGPNLLLPSASPRRHRATSMIASQDTHWSNPYLYPEAAIDSSRTMIKNPEDYDQYHLRHRAHSMSDFNNPETLPKRKSELESYDAVPVDRVTAPSSNMSFLAGYVTDQNTLYPDRLRQNLSYLSNPGEEDEAVTLSNYESLYSSDNSRPVSTISSSATSSLSSTLTPPPDQLQADANSYRTEKLAPQNNRKLDEHLLPSATSASSIIKKHFYSGELGTGADPVHLISPLERLSSLSVSRPTINRRQRSGTVLPPKKPELVFEASPDDSCVVLPIDSLLAKIEDHSIKPPARPPRSHRRGAIPQPTNHSPTRQNHDSYMASKEPIHANVKKAHPTSNLPTEPAGSIYDSAKSSPACLPLPVLMDIDQRKPANRTSPKPRKDLPDNLNPSVHSPNESRTRQPPPSRSPRGSAARPTSSGKNLVAPTNQHQRSQSVSSSSVANSGSEDGGEDFESAEEGDEQFWSAARSSHDHEPSSATEEQEAVQSSNQVSFESRSRLERDKPPEVVVPEKVTGPDQRRKKDNRVSMIGAFPRSESYADSFVSSLYSSSVQELSFEGFYQSPKPSPSPAPQITGINRRQSPPPQSAPPLPETSHPPRNPRRVSHLSASKAESSKRNSVRSAAPRPSPSRYEGSPVSPYPANRVANTPPKSPFDNFRVSRASSLEGLAALRNPNSISPQSPRKKTSVRSAHFRQLSKILSFCAKDPSFDENSSDETFQPIPSELGGNRQVRPLSSIHLSSPVQSKVTQTSPDVPSTWKNSLSRNAYDSLLNMYGAVEMQRQELIWELCETENSFAMGLRQVIEIFAFPLRTPEGAWISGVPVEVARLLDWLEDIVNLHSQMAFQARNCCQYQSQALGLVVHISEVFLELTPKLEVYQPYLIRFREVTAAIEEMITDVDSDFGEFVRMQSSLPECGRMSLTSFLLKPIQRLMKYPLFYKQLCEVTPPAHPDHEATVCLLNATDSMIRVLQEVKEREDEYEKLKLMESRVKGLPPGFKLVRRDRRLLAQGLLKRVQLSTRDQPQLTSTQGNPWALNVQTAQTNQGHTGSSPQSGYSSEFMGSSNSRNSYHSNWSQHSSTSSFSTPPESTKSHRSSYVNRENEPLSFLNYPNSPANPFPLGSKQFYDWMALSNKSPRPREDSQHYLRTRPNGPGESHVDDRNRRKSLPASRASRKLKESPIHVFVFSDIILLATRHSDGVRLIRSATLQRKKKDSPSYYSVLEDVGISGLVAVSDISGELEYPHLLKLDLLPFTSEAHSTQQTNKVPEAVYLTFPDRLPGSSQTSTYESVQKERYKWLSAFHQALMKTTVEPSMMRVQTEELSELVDPSNPAFQKIPPHAQERLERTWWSARHRLVAKELQELSNDDFPSDPIELDSSSYNSNSFDSLRVEPSQLLNTANPHHTLYLPHPHTENHTLLEQIKTSGLGLDFGF